MRWVRGTHCHRWHLGSVAAREAEGDVEPRAVFFTNTGRIGVISAVPQELGYLFTSLERNLNYALPGPAGLEHAQYVNLI